MSRDHHTFRYDGRREEARRPVGGRRLGGSQHPGGGPGGSLPRAPRPARRTWRGRLEALGVQVTTDGEVLRLSSLPSSRMKITGFSTRNGPGWRWSVSVGRDDMLPGISITSEDGITRVTKLVVGEDVLTGDADFDAVAHIKGDEAYLLARLSAATRKALRRLLDEGRVEDGRVWWSRAMDAERPDDLPEVVRRLITIARRLGGRVDIDARLRKHMVGDPAVGHRRRCLAVLLSRGDRLTGIEGRKLLSDAEHDIRLTAARVRQDVPTLVALARADAAPLEVRAAAVHSLGSSDEPAAVAGIDAAAGAVSPSAVVAALARWFERDPAVLDRLGETALLLLLDDGPRAVQGPVIDRLGEVGTEAAVPALVSIAGAFFGRRALKDRARAASGRITERQGGLRAGGLSVAEAPEGGLTMTGGGGDESR